MKSIPLKTAKKRLSYAWFFISGILFLVLFLQTILSHYGDRAQEAWSWFLPNIMPTLSLMIATFAADEMGSGSKKQDVSSHIYYLAYTISLFYLLLLSLVIFLGPFYDRPIFEVMAQSNIYLGALQGLTSGVLGVFFVKNETNL